MTPQTCCRRWPRPCPTTGGLYAVPFYGESSMLYYRTDLLKAAGLTMPAHPTWAQVQRSRPS